MGKKILIVLAVIIVIVMVACGIAGAWYFSSLKSVKGQVATEEEKELIRIEVEEGMGAASIAKLLYDNGIIKSELAMKIYSKLNSVARFSFINLFAQLINANAVLCIPAPHDSIFNPYHHHTSLIIFTLYQNQLLYRHKALCTLS